MSELEIQAEFRERVLTDLASERTKLDALTERVERLEQIVVSGNGHQALTVQVKNLETKMDNMGKEMELLRDEMGKMDELNNNVVEIKTQLAMKKESNGYLIGFVIAIVTAIVTVVGTALVQHFVHEGGVK